MCAELVLEDGAKIENYGLIKSFGFVRESAEDNGSEVNVYNGATLAQPFTLRDHLGGSRLYYIYNNGKGSTCAFTRMVFMNVDPLVTYSYGAKMDAWVNMYAGDQQNHDTITIVGYDSSAVVQMTDSTYSLIEAKYHKDDETMDLDIYGGAKTNSMNITVKATIGSAKINTKDFLFPLSYHHNITLHRAPGQTGTAEYSMAQDFRMHPGASLTVEEGAHLSIGKIHILDTSFEDTGDERYVAYPEANTVSGEVLGGSLSSGG